MRVCERDGEHARPAARAHLAACSAPADVLCRRAARRARGAAPAGRLARRGSRRQTEPSAALAVCPRRPDLDAAQSTLVALGLPGQLHHPFRAAMASTLASSSARPLLRLSHAAAPVRQAALSASYATAPQSSGVAIGRAAAAPPVASPFATADSASETERRREERRAQYEGMTEEQRRLALQKMRKRVGESARTA